MVSMLHAVNVLPFSLFSILTENILSTFNENVLLTVHK